MADWLHDAAQLRPYHLALKRANGTELSFAALNRQVEEMAARLQQTGLRAGQRVAWLGRDAAYGVTLMFALARLRVVFVPLNVRLAPDELRAQITLAEARALICERGTEAQTAPLAELVDVYSCDAPSAPDVRALPDMAQVSANYSAFAGFQLHDIQSIIFTSGTTGQAKGAQLTFSNHHASAQASAQRLGSGAADRWLLTLPLYHVGGMTIPMRAVLTGASVIEFDMSAGFDAERLMRVLAEERISIVSLVPVMLHRLLDAGFTGTSHLRVVLLGGAAAPADLLERAVDRGLPIAPTYGLTEACSQVATMPPDRTRYKPGSVGRPLDGTMVTIVRDDGAQAAIGETGEIEVRGPTVFQGYIHAPDDLAARHGTLRTGDLGYLDTDGDLFVLQRRVDLIISGGENIYPAEVEAVLRAHPAVSDVCVIGLPHAEWGQMVACALVLERGASLDSAALQAWCRERLATYKCPRLIHFVAALPLTASGKVIRRDVATLLAAIPT